MRQRIPSIRATQDSGGTRIECQKLAHAVVVGQDRGDMDAASAHLRVRGEDRLSFVQRARSVR
jgi:hypothetical protein